MPPTSTSQGPAGLDYLLDRRPVRLPLDRRHRRCQDPTDRRRTEGRGRQARPEREASRNRLRGQSTRLGRRPVRNRMNHGRKKGTTKYTKYTKKRDREFHTQEQAELCHEYLNLS